MRSTKSKGVKGPMFLTGSCPHGFTATLKPGEYAIVLSGTTITGGPQQDGREIFVTFSVAGTARLSAIPVGTKTGAATPKRSSGNRRRKGQPK